VITILEKCSNKEERDNNVVKFVQLTKKLPEILSYFGNKDDSYEKWPDKEKWSAVDNFLSWIDETEKFVANKRFVVDEKIGVRVYLKKQKELINEGTHGGKYVGSKWGKYIRAPDIFFKILEEKKELFIPLKEIAEVRRGFTTGANKFFYLTEEEIKKWRLEREFWMHPLRKNEKPPIEEDVWKDEKGEYFCKSQYAADLTLKEVLRKNGFVYWIPNYLIRSPKECKSIIINPKDLKYRVLMIHKDKKDLKGTNVLKYIKWGEEQKYHKRDTCKSRSQWYNLGKRRPYSILFTMYFHDSYKYHLNPWKCFVDHTMYECETNDEIINKILILFLNSTFAFLYPGLLGRSYGGGAPTGFMVYEVEKLPVLNPRSISKDSFNSMIELFKLFEKREFYSIFEEVGANSPEEVSFDSVKPDRRKLDMIVMGEILGLSEEEQLEVYRAVIDLVKSRIEKAKSSGKRVRKKSFQLI